MRSTKEGLLLNKFVLYAAYRYKMQNRNWFSIKIKE